MKFCPGFIVFCTMNNMQQDIGPYYDNAIEPHTVISKKYCLCILLAVPTGFLLTLPQHEQKKKTKFLCHSNHRTCTSMDTWHWPLCPAHHTSTRLSFLQSGQKWCQRLCCSSNWHKLSTDIANHSNSLHACTQFRYQQGTNCVHVHS